MSTTIPTLAVDDLKSWYGESLVVQGASFVVNKGEVVTLIGRNGAGKTTILRSIMGLVPKMTGVIAFEGRQILGKRPDEIARMGIGYCPEERAIFSSLSVHENLMLPPQVASGGFGVAELHKMFPNLLERADGGGGSLSGGEQQMLALARIMRTGAPLLLLDEPSEGLAPVIVSQIGKTITQLKQKGITVLLVEQNLRLARAVSDRFYVVERGLIIDECSSADVARDPDALKKYLMV